MRKGVLAIVTELVLAAQALTSSQPVPTNNVIHAILVGPSTTGSAIEGGQSRHVGPGDVIIVPPGVARWFSKVDADMNYLVVRVDGDHILPAGYVNPVVESRR